MDGLDRFLAVESDLEIFSGNFVNFFLFGLLQDFYGFFSNLGIYKFVIWDVVLCSDVWVSFSVGGNRPDFFLVCQINFFIILF